MSRQPIVRHLIACRSVTLEEGDLNFHRVTMRILPEPGELYPLSRELVLCAVLTDVSGRHTLSMADS